MKSLRFPKSLTRLVRLAPLFMLALYLTACGSSPINQPPADSSFSLTLSPSPAAVEQGEAREVTVTLTRTGGFSEDVTLNVSGTPAESGITTNFTQDILSGDTASSTLQLVTSGFTAVQGYDLTVTATAGETIKSRTLALNVVQGMVDVKGRVIVPIEFLPEEMDYDQLFNVTRVWLLNPTGEPVIGTAVGTTGEYMLENVPAGEEGYRLIALFGSGDEAMMMENALAPLHPENENVTANITLETTLAAEIARNPELKAAYAAELQAYYRAETGETLEADLLESGNLYYPAWDYSSVADPFAEGDLTTLATGEVCAWYFPFTSWGVGCKKVPDLVIYSHSMSLEPNKELFRLSGTEIAKHVTSSNMNIYIEQVGENRFVFSGVNGIIGNATGNLIGNATGNVIAAGGYNLIAKQGATIIGAGGGNFTAAQGYILKRGELGVFPISSRYSGFDITHPNARLIGNGGSNLIGQAGSNLIGQAGSNLIGQAGSNMKPRFGVLSTSSPADTSAAAKAAIDAAVTTPYLKPEYLKSPTLITPQATIAAGHSISIAVSSSGQAYITGKNRYKELGLGSEDTNLIKDVAVAIPSLSNIKAVSASTAGGSVFAIKEDGTLWAWGYNHDGQLGIGAATVGTSVSTPTQVNVLQDVTHVAAGIYHTLAVQDGRAWAWGDGYYGQMGQGAGNTADQPEPVQVPDLTGVVAVATGLRSSLALLDDGTVWSWGLQSVTSTIYYSPTKIASLSNIVDIAAGSYGMHLALDNEGQVWAWGNVSNLFETRHDFSVPTLIPNLDDVVSISAGGYGNHAMFIKSDGTLWGLGKLNNWGQLGIGSTAGTTTPLQVPSLSNIVAVSAGHVHTVALDTNGTLWAWGDGNDGQLGNDKNYFEGGSTGSSLPLQMIGLQNSIKLPQ